MCKYQYVQYGCGWSAPIGWKNFDASLTLRFERLPIIGKFYTKNESRFPRNVEYGDIVKGLPVPDETSQGIYCSHVLEHLSLAECKIALKNTFKIMKPGGLFRMVLPDLEHLAKQYINDSTDDAALNFMKESHLGLVKRSRGLYGLLIAWLGNSRHLWLWDYKSLDSELRKAGFIGIRRAFFGDSIDPMFNEVEDRERWNNCLGVECNRPDYQTARL